MPAETFKKQEKHSNDFSAECFQLASAMLWVAPYVLPFVLERIFFRAYRYLQLIALRKFQKTCGCNAIM